MTELAGLRAVGSGGEMLSTEKVQTRLQALDERLARLRAEKERLVARANEAARRRDSKRPA